eukprot:6167086-Amphidinium_carterae.1
MSEGGAYFSGLFVFQVFWVMCCIGPITSLQDRAAGKSQWERPPDFTGKVPDKPPETTTRVR